MKEPAAADPADPAPGPALSRRTLILGGVSLAVLLAAGGTTAAVLLSRHGGKLVPELLQTPGFTVAHRGGSANWPEMSMLAYRNAVEAGVDALEISLARTSDGVWFGLHDATLDRTSGTSDFVASEHSWAEVQEHEIGPDGTYDHQQPSQPYLRFDELVRAYGSTHALFVDPKVAGAENYPELLDLMASLVDDPAKVFVAKGYCTSTDWADAARAAGLESWGYFYGHEVVEKPALVDNRAGSWTMLGLDIEAEEAQWRQFTGLGKPVIAHILRQKAELSAARSRGAQGAMIAGIAEVLG